MLPLVARRELGLGPGGYGIMLACIGLGAICGAVVLPKLRKRLNADRMMVAASVMFAITMLALAVYLTVFFGSMTVGSAIWGKLASEFGISWALSVATVGMLLGTATVLRWRLEKDAALDLDIIAPTGSAMDAAIAHERGPVMVSCEYRIAPEDAPDFMLAVQEMRRVRRRTGAMKRPLCDIWSHPINEKFIAIMPLLNNEVSK